jgi:hypothetical protein
MNVPAPLYRLVRFVDTEGQVHYGELGTEVVTDDSLEGLTVSVYEGTGPLDSDFVLGPTKKKIAKV